jgi:hypothetical protein
MEEKKSIEHDMMENIERVLDNVFDKDEEKNIHLNKRHSYQIPKIFLNDHLLSNNELNKNSNINNNEMKPNIINENLNSENDFRCFLNEYGEKIEKIDYNKNLIDIEDYNKLKGNFLNLITSQNGSRFMQKIYLNTNYDILKKIFDEISNSISDCMIDPYANYFCQKFFGVLKKEERIIFLKSIIEKIIDISISKIGTYPLQSVIGQLNNENEIEMILNALNGKILDLCKNTQGVHVIEKIIICFNEDIIKEIYDVIIENFYQLAINQNGLFVCKKIIYQCKKEENLIRIRDILSKESLNLIYNQYGNYTIQVAVETWNKEFFEPIIENFYNNFVQLSCQKYSSNVIEKCLEKSGNKILNRYIDEVCKNNNIITLIKNGYGNFVLQKSFKLSNGRSRIKLINSIKKNIEKLNDQKLINKWKTLILSSSYLSLENSSTFFSQTHLSSSPISERKNNMNNNIKNNSFNLDSNTQNINNMLNSNNNFHSSTNSPMMRPQLSLNNSPFLSPMIQNSPIISSMRLMNINSPIQRNNINNININNNINNIPISHLQNSPIMSPLQLPRNIIVNNNNNFISGNTLMIPSPVFIGNNNTNINNINNEFYLRGINNNNVRSNINNNNLILRDNNFNGKMEYRNSKRK